MLSDEIKALVGETDDVEGLEAILDKANALETVLAETQKKVEEKDMELAEKNKKIANFVLSATETKKVEKIDADDFSDMTEEEFDNAMKAKYGEDSYRKEIVNE